MKFSFSDVKPKTVSELQTLLAEGREELRIARFAARQNGLKKVRNIRALRQRVAHILTALNTKRS
jgi:ribosomal protein L29